MGAMPSIHAARSKAGSVPGTVKRRSQKGLPDVSDGGVDRTVPAPPRWQESERASRIWREPDDGRKLPKDKKD